MGGESQAGSAARIAEQVARESYGKLVSFLAAGTRDVAAAEDALADAFAAALATWPERGVPDSPEAWLLVAARRRFLDQARRAQTRDAAGDDLALIAELLAPEGEDSPIPDHRLRLIFACAHPAIEPAARAPLILQTLLGFDAQRIASAFLVAPATMAQRLVRAKRKIRDAGIPFRLPEVEDLPERLDAVLDAIYAVFTQGWADPMGADAQTRGFTGEAIFLGRMLTEILPGEPETLGLLALMLHAEARRPARRDAKGSYVPLAEHDTTLWDHALMLEAESLIIRASRIGPPGRFQLEAAVQSAHAARYFTGVADWPAILALYDGLLAMTGSPVVAVNRAVALGQVQGPVAGLAALDRLADDVRLGEYQPYWAARAELLARAGDAQAADRAYGRAIGLESDQAVRDFLEMRRRSGLDPKAPL